MLLSEFKKALSSLSTLTFVQPNGVFVPRHFHITEIGLVTKHFIDCGGDIHNEQVASLQIWVAEDFEHRLKPSGLSNIIDISKKILGDTDLEIEVEYQTETIGKYNVGFDGTNFNLIPKQTDCLAKIACGIPQSEKQLKLASVELTDSGCCTPGGKCC